MAGPDVAISYADLKELNSALIDIWDELDQCSSRATSLEHAIGDPFGQNRLREAAEEFEDGWDDKRKELKENVRKVQERTDKVLKGWNKWDQDTANGLGSGHP